MGTINLAAGVQWCRQGTVRWMEGREGPRLFKGQSDEEWRREGGGSQGKAKLRRMDTRGHISGSPTGPELMMTTENVGQKRLLMRPQPHRVKAYGARNLGDGL